MVKKKETLEEPEEEEEKGENEKEDLNRRNDIQDKWIINLIKRVKNLEDNFQKCVEESLKK